MFQRGLRSGDDQADEDLPALEVFWKERLSREEAYYDHFKATQAKLKATQAELEATQAKLAATQAKLTFIKATYKKPFEISDTN